MTVTTTAAAAAAAANAQNGDPTASTASGPGKKPKDSSGTQSDDSTGDSSAASTNASPGASAGAPTPVATVIVVNSAIDTTPGAAANASTSLAIGAQAKGRALIASAHAASQDTGASQNTDSGANAGAAAGNATTAADANSPSNAPAAPADAAPVAANFQQALNQADSTPTQGDPSVQGNSATITAHAAGTTGSTEAAGSAQPGAATKAAATNLPTFGIVAANITGTTPQTATTAAATEPTVALAGLPVAIASRAQAGSSQFDIRLDPPELGRIEVQLSVDSNGQVVSHITADRQDTLNLLQSQQPQLQQALEQAGLKTSDSAMQFSLRDQSFAGQQQQNQNFAQNGNNSQSNTQQLVIPDSSLSSVDTTQIYSRLNLRGGLDIRV